MSETTQTPEAQPEAQLPSLTLQDLMLTLQTIQAVVQRGAIRAEEMSTIGGLHDRLVAFLTAQGVIGQKAEEPAAAPEA
jgi:hypothetical protein